MLLKNRGANAVEIKRRLKKERICHPQNENLYIMYNQLKEQDGNLLLELEMCQIPRDPTESAIRPVPVLLKPAMRKHW